MIWDKTISFEGLQEQIDTWYREYPSELCDPPINPQFALDLIFKTLIDDKEQYPYLTALPESTEQTNSIMLDLILKKYSRKYRRFKRKQMRSPAGAPTPEKKAVSAIWNENISFEGFQEQIDAWYQEHPSELCDPPINPQFALDLIFKTLMDDDAHYKYLTTMPESTEQINSIMLDKILKKYSRKYRRFKRKQRKQ